MGKLYNFERLMALKEAMKRHLYKVKIGDEAVNAAHEPMNNYNPLSFIH